MLKVVWSSLIYCCSDFSVVRLLGGCPRIASWGRHKYKQGLSEMIALFYCFRGNGHVENHQITGNIAGCSISAGYSQSHVANQPGYCFYYSGRRGFNRWYLLVLAAQNRRLKIPILDDRVAPFSRYPDILFTAFICNSI